MPIIGLLSDSHGHVRITRHAVALLKRSGAEMLVHLGDVGAMAVLDELIVPGPDGEKPIEAATVFGNTDWDWRDLARYATSIGIKVGHPVGTIPLDGGPLVFLHGDDTAALWSAIESGARYVCHGHTHERKDQRIGQTRVINPGALHRAAEYTVALLDTQADRLTFVDVTEGC